MALTLIRTRRQIGDIFFVHLPQKWNTGSKNLDLTMLALKPKIVLNIIFCFQSERIRAIFLSKFHWKNQKLPELGQKIISSSECHFSSERMALEWENTLIQKIRPKVSNTQEYSVSTNFRLELIEASAREVEGQQFFFSSDAVLSLASFEHCSLLLSSLAPPPLISSDQSPKNR